MVNLETNFGLIELTLNPEKAPRTVQNFVGYVESGFFDKTIFHRVINNFMIQGGGFTEDMEQKDTENPIENEASNGLSNKAGTIAMARTQDPHSATAQFFINVNDNDFLDFKQESVQGWGYCVFGQVTQGLDVIEKIKLVNTGNHGYHQDVPVEPIVIEQAQIKA
ncbi:MAG: peptidyl-prolyl cis-trans isomerase [Shewanellaceae bacterium]|nr:peptidyl-prolyl cis-trans isomerase [Shewanellaceae bacterium]